MGRGTVGQGATLGPQARGRPSGVEGSVNDLKRAVVVVPGAGVVATVIPSEDASGLVDLH